MKLLHLSDSHFDERGRLDDVSAVHEEISQIAVTRAVDLVVHAGDWFERRSAAKERNAVAAFLAKLADVCPVVGVKGNHDQPGELDIFNRLFAMNDINIADRPGVFHPFGRRWDNLDRFSVVTLPWFDKAHLVGEAAPGDTPEQTRQATIAAARQMLIYLRSLADAERAEGRIPILVGHVMVGGSLVSTGQCIIGQTVELAPSEILEVGCEYAALGHVHKAQEWHGGRVAYSGSPHRCNFGEPEDKGVRIVTFDKDGKFESNEFVRLAARRIVRVDVDMTGTDPLAADPLETAMAADIKGALVRLRCTVAPEDAHYIDARAWEARLVEEGAAEAVVEIITFTKRQARAPEIVTAPTLADKLNLFLDTRGMATEPVERERVVGKGVSL